MIFDINMDGKFTIKAILVADGYTTAPPSYITYSNVMFKESVRISFLLESLNDIYIISCVIGNTFLNANYR